MKKLFCALTVVSIALFSAFTIFSQKVASDNNDWNGLILNVSTPDDAINLFGAAVNDKNKQKLEILRAESWLSGKQNERVFRTLTYKNLHNNKSVELSFLDNKLVMISLETPNALKEPEWIDPDELAEIYNADFKPYARKAGKTRPAPAEFQASAPEELSKGSYKYWYDMLAVTKQSFIVAVVNNNEKLVGGALLPRDPTDLNEKRRRKEINFQGKYPGYVERVQIISRKLSL
jgi:hypothetical protein